MEMEKRILGALNHIQETLTEQGETLKEHGRMLSALKTGQEELKAEIDGMKRQNAKEFSDIKDRLENLEASYDVLKDETWTNKRDVYRIKNTLGLK
ncbi:hypothetical protein ACE1TI_14290 [Alteribacillus sp. JSM 102045]|uniref:hypothetical protein n=1 Tax=Alteribacillus sp. JSM 102045 TaxID=1562101 RepID=UPI0035C19AE9